MVIENQAPVIVPIPAELASRMEALKVGRAEDRCKPLEELVLEMCHRYVRLREMALEEAAMSEALEESYRLRPYDFPDDWPQDEDLVQENSKPQEKQ